MGKKNPKGEEKKVRAADFANFQTSDSRPTGLHQIFASFNSIPRPEGSTSIKQESSTGLRGNRSQEEGNSDTSESQADILALLNKLTKKDSVTKLKALETFNELVETTPESVLEEFVVDVIHLFKKSTVVEPVKKIRLEFGILLGRVANKLKRKLQHHLESFITHWWICMHDESAEVADVYVEAFRNLFTTALSDEEFELKTLKILNFYFSKMALDYLEFLNKDLDQYSKEWLDVYGKSSQSSASIADMHNRLFYSILHSLMKLFIYARVHREEVEFSLDTLVHDHFVLRVTAISKLSFKKRLSCVLMLVEMVKVLPRESHRLLEKLISYASECLKMETEPALIYHNVRLICACTRENSSSLTKFLPNYENVVVSLLTNFNGEYGNKVDLYTLFPSLYMYIDPEYFNSYKESFENVLTFLTELMRKEVASLRRNAYTFDLVSFRSLGTRMLCCFYKLLLLSKKKAPELITLPLQRLAPVVDNSRDFLWNYPAVMTEYVAESNLLSEGPFVETVDRMLSYSGENTVLVASILDSLMAKYGPEVSAAYPGLERVYEELMRKATARLPACLEVHLRHEADLTLDIEQLVHLLKKNSLALPHHIPLLLFKSQTHSHAEFMEDYKLLLQVYKSLNASFLGSLTGSVAGPGPVLGSTVPPKGPEAPSTSELPTATSVSSPLPSGESTSGASEELDPRLMLFYSVVEMEHNPKLAEIVLGKEFDLEDMCTYFLVNEFINGCKGLGLSNELVVFGGRHVNLELFHNLLGQVDYSDLSIENRRVYESILITYQLYENKYVEFEGEYDTKMAENVLTAYLYLFLKKRFCDYVKFTSFVLEHFGKASNGGRGVDEECVRSLEALKTSAEPEFESTGTNLGALLGLVFDPNFVVEVINRTVRLIKDEETKKLHKRCYYVVVNAYMKWDSGVGAVAANANRRELNVQEFLKIFVKILVGSGLEYCSRAYGDFVTISTTYRLDEGEISRRFLETMLEEFMEERYETVKKLEDSVKIFEYFYKALRVDLPKNVELVNYVKTWYSRNLAPSHFLSSIYRAEEASEEIIGLELHVFSLSAANLQKKLETDKLEECESYTFLNKMTLVTNLLSEYKKINNISNLERSKLEKLIEKGLKDKKNQDLSPHKDPICNKSDYTQEEQDSSNDCPLDTKELLSNAITIFFGINLHTSLESSWAYLSIYKYLSLFLIEPEGKLKNDIHALNFGCIKHLYSRVGVYSVSTNLLTSFTDFVVENGHTSEFSLGTELELERIFGHCENLRDELGGEFGKLTVSASPEATSLAYWLPLCLKFGYESLRHDDAESTAAFAESVCRLLNQAYALEPSARYVNVYVSRLWECRSFYPKISESGIFCNLPNREHVCMISTFGEGDYFYDLNTCKLDAYRLLYTFNNYSNKEEPAKPDEEGGVNGVNEEGAEKGDEGESDQEIDVDAISEAEKCSISMEDVRNGYDLMKLYFSLIIGPYLTGKIMRTHVYLAQSDPQEIEKCLISWLTVFNMHAKYKALGNLNCANALVKLLTEKPHELGEYINEAFQENLGEALQDTQEFVDMSFIYAGQFGLPELYAEEYYEKEHYRNSLLDIFLQLLILCLEKMLIKDAEFCETVKLLYYKAAKIFPMQVSEMWNNCKNSYVKKNIKKFTKHEVTQKLVKHELEALKTLTNDLTVYYDTTKKEVTAKLFIKNEINAKISIKVPSAFPLEPLTFVSNEAKKNHKWVMFSHSEANRSGIAQGLLLWYNNVVKYYQGIDECPICYSIVHAQFQSIPTKPCKVCKYKFHKECLFKWFRNAAKAKCPLCQSQVSFL